MLREKAAEVAHYSKHGAKLNPIALRPVEIQQEKDLKSFQRKGSVNDSERRKFRKTRR